MTDTRQHTESAAEIATASHVPDEDTLARATLTFCIDGADALMFATIKGAQGAIAALRLIHETKSDSAGCKASQAKLDEVFATGTARWGRKVNARGMQAFHRALQRWHLRLNALPSNDESTLIDYFTNGGEQWIIGPTSPCWPSQLDDLSTRKEWATPLCLWGLGDPYALVSCSQPVAVVGSRGTNDYGRYVARTIAENTAENGHLVVSGGAYGVDAAAHWGALESMSRLGPEHSGRTVAVFAGGLKHMGPRRNTDLFQRMREQRGALISELCPDTIPEARRFLLRNRIIAALSSSVVVAQARTRSGALNTALWAADLGREVYAVPGNINTPENTGCNHLIRDNRAMLLTSVHETGIRHESHAPSGLPHINAIPCTTVPDGEVAMITSSAVAQSATAGSEAHDPIDHASLSECHQAIIRAYRRCRNTRIAATPDNLLNALNASTAGGSGSQNEPWTIAKLGQTLGAMELEGLVTMTLGVVSLATGTVQGQPPSRPPRRSPDRKDLA